jgi:ParB family chromosome partitioning protein
MSRFARLAVADAILPPQVRTVYDELEERRLGDSLEEHGQIQAIVVAPDCKTVLVGGRRVRALRLKGVEFVEAKILDEMPTDCQLKVMQLAENCHRKSLSGWEKWVAATDILAMNPTMTAKELAKRLKISPANMVRWLAPSRCPAEAQDALKQGLINLGACYPIAKAKTPEQQQALLANKLAGMGRDALEEEGRRVRARSKPAVKVNRAKLILMSGVSIVVSGAAICLENVIESLSQALKAARSAREDNQDIKAFALILKNKAAKKGAMP